MTLPGGTQTVPVPTRRSARSVTHDASVRTLVSASSFRKGPLKALYYGVLITAVAVFALIFLFPMYWMVTGALKAPTELAQSVPTLIPQTFEPESFANAWSTLRIGHYLFNTVLYTFGGWLAQILVAVTVAYALSRLRPWGGKLVLGLMLASLMLPATALLIPTYLTVVDLPVFGVNLLNTPWALWLPAAANAFNIYVLKRFFDQIPQEILDSASIDGAGRIRILWRIVLPLSRPVLAVVSIFAIVAMWRDFVWPLMVLPNPEAQTISVALSRLSGSGYVPANEMLAGLVMASIPMVVVFLLLQRHILNGLSVGGSKG